MTRLIDLLLIVSFLAVCHIGYFLRESSPLGWLIDLVLAAILFV